MIADMFTATDVMKRQKASKKNVVIFVTCQIVMSSARQSIRAESCSRSVTFVRSSIWRLRNHKRNFGTPPARI